MPMKHIGAAGKPTIRSIAIIGATVDEELSNHEAGIPQAKRTITTVMMTKATAWNPQRPRSTRMTCEAPWV